MKLDIVRAWKDETYRQALSEEQFRTLPANPAGELELADTDLMSVYGGTLIPILSNIRLFSLNILASPITQTCAQIR
jgi:mersacidin/lichenicidin family type 2 lantibiotic